MGKEKEKWWFGRKTKKRDRWLWPLGQKKKGPTKHWRWRWRHCAKAHGTRRYERKESHCWSGLVGKEKKDHLVKKHHVGNRKQVPEIFWKDQTTFFKEELSRWIKSEAGQRFCLFDTSSYQVQKNLIRWQKSCQVYFLGTVVIIMFYSQKVKPTNCQAISDWERWFKINPSINPSKDTLSKFTFSK